ncbi:hypothetical protein [Mycolicibacterium madagascariense]|nr:hypothetical protein [Mycolicibacterium madagascariense]MCV7011871.1 hypothetical protein [Mycolicibacterium madagascariense]
MSVTLPPADAHRSDAVRDRSAELCARGLHTRGELHSNFGNHIAEL